MGGRRITAFALLSAALFMLIAAPACTRPPAPAGTPGAEGTPAAEATPGTPGAGPAAGVTPEAVSVTLPSYDTVDLPNGARLLLAERHDVPLIAFTALVRGGAVADPADKAGTAAVLAEVMTKGAGARSAQAFAEALDGVGGTLAVTARREFLELSGEFLAQDADLMVELLADVLRRPALADDEIVKVRDRAIESIASSKDSDLRRLVSVYGQARLFGAHPYGRPVDGSESSLARVAPADVRAFHTSNVGADRLILAVVGDFAVAGMRQGLEAAFGDWPAASGAAPEVAPAFEPREGRQVLLVHSPEASQTYFWIGNVGVARSDPETPAIDLANTVFGGRFTSILNNALRIESGLTYGASSSLSRNVAPGAVAIVSFTETDTTEEAIDMAIDLLGKYRQDGMDEQTLASAQAYTLGQFPLDLETGGDIAARLAQDAFYGLGDDDVNAYGERIAAVDTAAAKAAIDRLYPAPEDLTIVLIGDAAKIRTVAEKYGTVVEMDIKDPEFMPAE